MGKMCTVFARPPLAHPVTYSLQPTDVNRSSVGPTNSISWKASRFANLLINVIIYGDSGRTRGRGDKHSPHDRIFKEKTDKRRTAEMSSNLVRYQGCASRQVGIIPVPSAILHLHENRFCFTAVTNTWHDCYCAAKLKKNPSPVWSKNNIIKLLCVCISASIGD
ncbi:uncharacterized protein [Littorina saxatilis]|uniref:uncharacterized protein isoform X3 n=1 Tax=Littorina saxatilis TaxID=31220 RepID=UPI0038B5D7B5